MGVRLPLQTVLDYDDVGNVGATSVAGGVAKTFTVPQDADGVLVKFTASIAGGGASAVLQTTDDGGTTWYDVGRTSVVSNANTTTAVFTAGFVNAGGISTAINGAPTNSVLSVGISNTAASTLAQRQVSGLPLLSPLNRVFLRYDAAVSLNDLSRVQVKVNSQSQGT